ncbi:MAG: class I SAM-dependent methyltransferase, partial [Acidimicrobiia bacterium]|nr:class I SAM-dependent methyltransferase [Acidimicrobiia bacterium]
GCGSGAAAAIIARSFPASEVVGFDVSVAGIAAAKAGYGDIENLRFELGPLEEMPADPGFDLITSFDVVHDLGDPEAGMRHIRQALRPDGVFLMMEPAASSNLEDNLTPRGALLYGVSAMHCMTQSLAAGGQGVGTAWGRQVIEATARRAGFITFEHLDGISNSFSDFFVLA